ncbi:MAG: hypothetical protein U0992_10365 [Planctomycetaceae bacterium]
MTTINAGAIAAFVRGDLLGNSDHEIHDVAPLDQAGPEHLAFVAAEKSLRALP